MGGNGSIKYGTQSVVIAEGSVVDSCVRGKVEFFLLTNYLDLLLCREQQLTATQHGLSACQRTTFTLVRVLIASKKVSSLQVFQNKAFLEVLIAQLSLIVRDIFVLSNI